MGEQEISDLNNVSMHNADTENEEIKKQIAKAKKKGRWQGIGISVLIVLAVLIAVGVINITSWIKEGSFYAHALSAFGGHVVNSEVLKKTDMLYALIDSVYYEDVDKDKLRDGIYKGLLAGIGDPYSVYYNEEEYAEMLEDSSGIFEGIGAMLQQDPETKKIKVVRPIKDSPAKKVGIRARDTLVSVDGMNVANKDIDLVVSKIRGPKGTKVEIGVRRDGVREILKFDIIRDEVISESVEYEMKENKVGYIMITEFAEKTAEQFKTALTDLENKGMESLIVDLRSNGGGYVKSAVEIADMFVKEGPIVSVRYKNNQENVYEDMGDDNFFTLPCVILADGYTASASEILIGCLRDYELATVIGTSTFGKGIMQDVISLDNNTGVKITSAKYYSPNGTNIHGIGFEPDIEVEWNQDSYDNDGLDNQIEAAINYLTYGNIEGK